MCNTENRLFLPVAIWRTRRGDVELQREINPARAALAEYSRENDWLQDFIEDCCCIGPSHTAGSQELYTMYAMHCQATGAGYKRDAREFRQALTAAGYESRRQNKGVRFYGLGLKSAAAPDV